MTTRPLQIQAITFDVGGTLIEPWPSVGHVYAEVAWEHGAGKLEPDVLNARFADTWRAQKDFSYTREAWAAIVDETFRGLISPSSANTFFPTLYQRFTREDAWRIFEDVEPTLSALARRGVRLGIISNWDERLRPLLKALRLARHFESIVVSCEAGATKPSPVIFQKAIASLGAAPETILHVGDSAALDVAGAQAAGMQALLIRRGVTEPAANLINSLTDLLPMIQSPRPGN